MPRQLFTFVVLLSLFTISSALAQAPPAAQRKWQDASGQFSVEAEFVGLADGKVELKKADGKIISIPLEKLAAADQAVAKSLAETAAAAKVPPRDPNHVEVVTYRGITQVAKLTDTPTWRGKPDPRPGNMPALHSKPMFVPLEDDERTPFEAYLDDVNHHAWIMVEPPSAKAKEQSPRFERLDLKTGERLTPVPALLHQELISVSPSGRLAAVFERRDEGVIHIFDLSADPPRKLRTVCPFHPQALNGMTKGLDEGQKGLDIEHAIFLDDNLLLVQPEGRNLALIDLKTLNARYLLEVLRMALPSPGRQQVVVRSGNHIYLIDALTGKSLGRLEASQTDNFMAQAFHPDGSRLAAVDTEKAVVWNLATGKQELSQPLPLKKEILLEIGFGKDHDHLVIGGKTVFNLKTGAQAGQQINISANYSPSFTHGGREWYVVIRKQPSGEGFLVGVTSLELPLAGE